MMKTRWCALLLMLGVCTNANAELYRWFKFDTDTGDEAVDSSPNGENGEIFDAEFVQDDVRGTVIELDGEISWVDAGFLPLMDLDNNFTWSFWENQSEFQNSPANDIILGNRWGGDGQADTSPREFIKFTPNRFEYHMNGIHDNDMTYGEDDPEHIPSDDEWRHHVVVKQADTLTYYRDGELFNEHELVDPMFSEDPLPIAVGGQYGAETWGGLISDLRLYTDALTADQVAIVLEGGDPLGETDPWLKLDDGSLTDPVERVNYIHDVLKTWVGDSNQDGEFSSADLVQVFAGGVYEDDIAGNGTWGNGDWNGSGEFDTADLVYAFQDGGFELGPRPAVASVPEPSSLVMIGLGLLALVRRRRR